MAEQEPVAIAAIYATAEAVVIHPDGSKDED